MTQMNLGAALAGLGDREGGSDKLKEFGFGLSGGAEGNEGRHALLAPDRAGKPRSGERVTRAAAQPWSRAQKSKRLTRGFGLHSPASRGKIGLR